MRSSEIPSDHCLTEERDAIDPQPTRQTLPRPGLGGAILLATLPLLAQFGMLIVCAIVAIAFLLVSGREQEAQAFFDNEFQAIVFTMGPFATLVVALVVGLLMFGRSTWSRTGWRICRPLHWILVSAISLPLAILSSELTNCVEVLLVWMDVEWLLSMRNSGRAALQQYNQLPLAVVFVSGCLVPGLGEEMFCRGILSRGLVARYGVVTGTLLTAFLFGMIHLEPVQAVGAMWLGVALQFVFLMTRSLPAAIALHTFNNVLAFLVLRYAAHFRLPGISPARDGAVEHTPWPVLLAAILTTSVLVVVIFRTRARWIVPDGSAWSPGYQTSEVPPLEMRGHVQHGRVGIGWIIAACLAYGLLAASLFASVS